MPGVAGAAGMPGVPAYNRNSHPLGTFGIFADPGSEIRLPEHKLNFTGICSVKN